jgi:transcriptional regulator with XRE-family HTH domain
MDSGVSALLMRQFDLRTFAERLEMLRRSRQISERLGLPSVTRSDLARALGITKERYFRYERAEIHPPLDVLVALRNLTGVSLDWLIAGIDDGELPSASACPESTVGDRLRWVREAFDLSIEELARYMGIDAETWRRFEAGGLELPHPVAVQFAHRYCVTLDFIYTGDTRELEPEVALAVFKGRPEMRGIPPARPVPRFRGGPATSGPRGMRASAQ